MSGPAADPYLALRHPGYRRYMTGHFLSNVGRQALTAAVTWQIYKWTNSATALGLVGLVNVLPLVALTLPAGSLADRLDRRRIIRRSMLASAVLSTALVLVTHWQDRLPDAAPLHAGNDALRWLALIFERQVDPASLHFDSPALPLVYLLLLFHAIARVLANPARAAIVPQLLPDEAVSNAITWNSSLFELSTVIGPALGGAVVAYGGYSTVYVLDIAASLTLGALMLRMPLTARPEVHTAPSASMLAGVRFILHRKPILAAMTLDLFAVLVGGAVALLPIYADQILHVGAAGFGWLRSAPAVGAAATAIITSHLPPYRRPGVVMLWAVAGFGVAMTVFSLSTSFALSLAALVLSGTCDNLSVVIRHTMVQLLTPDALRGRVMAVNQMFIGCSNELSSVRAGLMAALIGPVMAAASGGFGIFVVTGFVAKKWPSLKIVPPLYQLRPENEFRAAMRESVPTATRPGESGHGPA